MNSERLNLPDETKSRLVRILLIADVIGDPGLKVMQSLLPGLIRQRNADFIIANGENGSDGRGIDTKTISAYRELGIDVITSGNHIWDKAPIRREFHKHPYLLRPVNYPPGAGGHGKITVKTKTGIPVTVFSLQGRTYLPPIDCPFRCMDHELQHLDQDSKVIIVDFHAESTAEKIALGWHLDGRISALIGTHTHVQTADDQILPGKTGYITDAGMTGPFDSVIGMDTKNAIRRFITKTPQPNNLSQKNLHISGVYLEIDAESGHCESIERLFLP